MQPLLLMIPKISIITPTSVWKEHWTVDTPTWALEPVYAQCSQCACNLPQSPAPVPKCLSNYLCSQPVQCGTQPSIICPPYWALWEQSVWCGALPTEKIQLVVTSLKEFLMSVQLWPHSVCELASMWWYPTHPPSHQNQFVVKGRHFHGLSWPNNIAAEILILEHNLYFRRQLL